MRYFIEVAYKGTKYAGFQIQQNANTIQAEVENALQIYYRQVFSLTGSSRTDAGVHAKQNFFHFDADFLIVSARVVYHINAILPNDIVVISIYQVKDNAHCRFDALSRTYKYHIYNFKNPFLEDTASFSPIKLDINLLNQAACLLLTHTNYQSFSKKNTQVFTSECKITESSWAEESGIFIYTITGNRFLRGMVRGLVGTMMLVAKSKITVANFKEILQAQNSGYTDFSTAAKGLTLHKVRFEE